MTTSHVTESHPWVRNTRMTVTSLLSEKLIPVCDMTGMRIHFATVRNRQRHQWAEGVEIVWKVPKHWAVCWTRFCIWGMVDDDGGWYSRSELKEQLPETRWKYSQNIMMQGKIWP